MLRSVPDSTATFADLRGFLAEPGCAICRCAQQTADRFFTALLDEYINEPETRQALREVGGFCAFHAGELLARRNPLGTAILYNDLLSQRRATLERWRHQRPLRLSAPRGLTVGGEPHCPVCAAERETERRAAEVLARGLDEGALGAQWSGSTGLCWPHFSRVRPLARRGRVVLDEHQAAQLDQTLAELRLLIDSFDYRNREGRPPHIETAWRRAVPRAVGDRRMPPQPK